MRIIDILAVFTASVFLFLALTPVRAQGQTNEPLLLLRNGWRLASGCALAGDGAQLSSIAYTANAKTWKSTTVPSTVLAAQVRSGEFPDPYFARNLRAIPGTDYPVGKIFSRLPMSAGSPYMCPWWYRTQFEIPKSVEGKTLWLRFGGINYQANLWINGRQVADSDAVAGAYRTYEFDVTEYLKAGKQNAIAIEIFAPTEHDLSINWVDWSPAPPDKDMGLTGEVALYRSGPVSVRSPMVRTRLLPSAAAELTVYGELHNATAQTVRGLASMTLLGVHAEQAVELQPGESRTVVFSPERFPQLTVHRPPLWWPYQMGKPHLETLRVKFFVAGTISDDAVAQVGIREITSELTEEGARLFRVNRRPILIRGAGWSEDMLLREETQRLQQQFEMVRDLHLNAIRLEGKLETDAFYRLADEQGILVLAGWCCCDQWEQWAKWTPENDTVAAASLRSQMLRLRGHPSLLVWLNGSDNPPPPKVETMYLDIEHETHWPNPTLSSASARATEVSGETGVKMTGPYDYVAPSYWLTDPGKHGGAWGFNTETSPGPAIPTETSLRRFLPAGSIWPRDNDDWRYHDGSGAFANTDVFDTAMQQSYGEASSLAEYERMAQAMAYDGERAMYEAYGRNKYTSTGVVQWMLNNAWPSMIWHLYDYYLDAGGGYFGARKACEPLHVQYSYDDRSVVVVNSAYAAASGLRVRAAIYDLRSHPVYEHEARFDMAADSSARVFTLPVDVLEGELHFLHLTVTDAVGRPLSDNFYGIPAKPAVFDWQHGDYRYTPALHEPDLRALNRLPRARVVVETETGEPGGSVAVRLRNSSQALAFQVVLRALDAHHAVVAPAFWSDNYVSLLPGEVKTFSVRPSLHGGPAIQAIQIMGWNFDKEVTAIPRHPPAPHESASTPPRASTSAIQPRRSDDSATLER